MPSPFPGMDPYLEDPAVWRDFHTDFLANLRAALNARLPDDYSAQIEEAVRLVQFDPAEQRTAIADVTVTRDPTKVSSGSRGGGAATLEPVAMALPQMVEVREHWVEVVHRPDRQLVTLIELLSPKNKADGRDEYLAKRMAVLKQPVHLVEIDLLLSGKRLPMNAPLPPGDYYYLVSRADRRPVADVYAWSIRSALPSLPIPLKRPDADVVLDLAELFAETYRRGAYERLVDYRVPPAVRLRGPDLTWATETAGRAVSR